MQVTGQRYPVQLVEPDAIASARRRLPMTEVAPVKLVGADGPTPLHEIFEGRSQLLVFKHMFHVGKPIEEQCEGCTINLFTFQEPVYLEARGITFVVFSEGPHDELAAFKEFMGYRMPWYSTYGVDEPAVSGGGSVSAYLRNSKRVFQTYETTDRGTESMITSLQLLDLTVYGRQETWEDSPEGWPQDPTFSFWRKDGRPTAQWTRPGPRPFRTRRPAPLRVVSREMASIGLTTPVIAIASIWLQGRCCWVWAALSWCCWRSPQ